MTAALLVCLQGMSPQIASSGALDTAAVRLEIKPIVQTPERCGQAALEMVLRYYSAPAAAVREVEGAYDPVLHGSLITDLAGAARRGGFLASVATLAPDSLVALLREGVPTIVLIQNGRGPLTMGHFGVVVGWDPIKDVFALNDGGSRAHTLRRDELARRWKTAGSQALVVRRGTP